MNTIHGNQIQNNNRLVINYREGGGVLQNGRGGGKDKGLPLHTKLLAMLRGRGGGGTKTHTMSKNSL